MQGSDISVATWILGSPHYFSSTISDLTRDEDLDERMYFYSVGSPVANAPFDMDVYGIQSGWYRSEIRKHR